MTPLTLTIVGVALVALPSLVSALKSEGRSSAQAKLVLSLPLVSTFALLYSLPLGLSLNAFGLESGEALSLTLQYDQPAVGLGVIEAFSSVPHPMESILSILFGGLAGLALVSALALSQNRKEKREFTSKLFQLTGGAWILTWLTWALTHATLPFSSGEGESGVRSLLRLTTLDPLRVKRFALPQEAWWFSTPLIASIILSVCVALLILISVYLKSDAVPLKKNDEEESQKGDQGSQKGSKLVIHLGAMIAIVSALWSGSLYGFSGTVSDLALWGSVAITTSITNAQLSNVPRAAIATFCLIALCSVTYP